ncbi:Tripeptidyl-peptidase 2 [Zancudomyces culisetae]|uniref:tripeptidyl-peptidase II n=1 Tax=Zancudomyces culisetae TaxID=1213189 RepID=A0A1R1PRN3_ZANCU|nr:Tripeptidyl-peptidase 2 [Zancudomyces culisetae]|eukprot:OMH83599.1 Tripeptidyl-peptidase 2 [Zancudomyces culisetae]
MSAEKDIISSECEGKKVLKVIGASGNELILDPSWNIPSGKVRVGMKALFELMPTDLADVVGSENKETITKKHEEIVYRLRKELAKASESRKEGEKETPLEVELNARLKAIKTLCAEYEYFGPVFDVILFHDGQDYRVVVNNTPNSNDLTGKKAMKDYKVGREYDLLDKSKLFNYSIKIYDEGRIVSIVTAAGSHGTHVAGILAGNHPNQPEMNGVAPGAQLISLKIGDHRLGSLEVGAGLSRALLSLVEHRVDLANMSYGESITVANSGFWVNLLRDEVIRKYGCIFVSSAGNSGPGLSTGGAPGGTTDDVIGVGAYVGHQQMNANYFLLDEVSETPYTWSSLGPTFDGDRAVDIYGPGSAVASYPEYTLKKYEMINGTSMSSPNVCGCLSLLVSAMKSNKINVSPYRVKTAIRNTSKDVGTLLNIGFIQTEKAWNFICEHANDKDQDVAYRISVDSRGGGRGIYYRDMGDCTQDNVEDITIQPKFMSAPDKDNGCDVDNDARERVRRNKFVFEKRLVLVSSKSWVKVPDFLFVNSSTRTFRAAINCKGLAAGELHYAEIQAFEAGNPCRGAVLTIPVTVAKPMCVDSSAAVEFRDMSFKPTELKRIYIGVPDFATNVVVTVTSRNPTSGAPVSFIINLSQLLSQERHEVHEYQKYFKIGSGTSQSGRDPAQKFVHTMSVQGGVTMELVIGQFWSQIDCHTIDMRVEFSGLNVMCTGGAKNSIYIDGNAPSTKIDLYSNISRVESVRPRLDLSTLRKYVLPQSSRIDSLSTDRDVLFNGQCIYGMQLTYKMYLEAGKAKFNFPACDNFVYDSWFEDKMIQIFDCNKKRLGIFSIYPKFVDIPKKGEYFAIVLVRYPNIERLEAIKSSPLLVDIAIPSSFSLPIFRSFAAAYTSGSTTAPILDINRSSMTSIFVGVPKSTLRLPSTYATGDTFLGSLSFSSPGTSLSSFDVVMAAPINKSTFSLPIASQKSPSAVAVDSAASNKPAPSSDSLQPSVQPDDSKFVKVEISSDSGLPVDAESAANTASESLVSDAVFDTKVALLSKVKDKANQQALIDELCAANPSSLSLLKAILSVRLLDYPQSSFEFLDLLASKATSAYSDANPHHSQIEKITPDAISALLSAAEDLIKSIDSVALAYKLKPSPPSATPSKTDSDLKKKALEDKATLVDALHAKTSAMLISHCLNAHSFADQAACDASLASISAALDEYAKWALDSNSGAVESPASASASASTSASTSKSSSSLKSIFADANYFNTLLSYEYIKKDYGAALVKLNDYIAQLERIEANTQAYKTAYTNRLNLLQKLHWTCYYELQSSNKPFFFPKQFTPF